MSMFFFISIVYSILLAIRKLFYSTYNERFALHIHSFVLCMLNVKTIKQFDVRSTTLKYSKCQCFVTIYQAQICRQNGFYCMKMVGIDEL